MLIGSIVMLSQDFVFLNVYDLCDMDPNKMPMRYVKVEGMDGSNVSTQQPLPIEQHLFGGLLSIYIFMDYIHNNIAIQDSSDHYRLKGGTSLEI